MAGLVFGDLPIVTQAEAWRVLRVAEREPMRCGESSVAGGYWVESHSLGCREEAGDRDLWGALWQSWYKHSKDGVSVLIGDPMSGVFVSISPEKTRAKSVLGAEMLIELGATERKTGYIQLKLISPEEDGGDNWILKVTRIDPYGGEPWEGEFEFPVEEDAKSWFKMVQGDEDIDHLISIFTNR